MEEAKGVKGEITLKPPKWNSGKVPQGMEMNKPAAGCTTQLRFLPLPSHTLETTKNSLVRFASRSTFYCLAALHHWDISCIDGESQVRSCVWTWVRSQLPRNSWVESTNYVQRAMDEQTVWKGSMDEWLSAEKGKLSNFRAFLQQLEKSISLNCSCSGFPPVKADLGRMKLLFQDI